MNVTRMLALAAFLDTLPKRKFNMESYLTWDNDRLDMYSGRFDYEKLAEKFEECGTAGCIAGWACVLAGQKIGTYSETAAEWLGLTDNQGEELFMGHWPGGRTKDDHDLNPKATPQQAAKAIRRMVKEHEQHRV